MSSRQRLIYVAIAAVIALVALVALSSGGGDDEEAATPPAASTPTPEAATQTGTTAAEAVTPPPTPTPTPRPRPPLLTADKPRTLTFKSGETIRFRVRSDTADEVHVHGYDITRQLPAGRAVTLSFEGRLEGIYEVELHGSGAKLGSLRVEP